MYIRLESYKERLQILGLTTQTRTHTHLNTHTHTHTFRFSSLGLIRHGSSTDLLLVVVLVVLVVMMVMVVVMMLVLIPLLTWLGDAGEERINVLLFGVVLWAERSTNTLIR